MNFETDDEFDSNNEALYNQDGFLNFVKRIPWKKEEDELLRLLVEHSGGESWNQIADLMPDRTSHQCKQRWETFLDPELIRGPWTKEEDYKVVELVKKYGKKRWSYIATFLKGRTGKQCRERWHNHLNPEVNKAAWTDEEDLLLYKLHKIYGNKWAKIATYFNGRTDNSIKNHWHGTMRRKFEKEDAPRVNSTTFFKVPEVTVPKEENSQNSSNDNQYEYVGGNIAESNDVMCISNKNGHASSLSTCFTESTDLPESVLPNLQMVSINKASDSTRLSLCQRVPKKIIVIRAPKPKVCKVCSSDLANPFDESKCEREFINTSADPWWHRVACGMTSTQTELTCLARQFISNSHSFN